MGNWKERYQDKCVSPAEAAKQVRSGDVIATSVAIGIPYLFLDALADRAEELENVTLHEITISSRTKLFEARCKGHIRIVSAFFGAYERAYRKAGADLNFQPIHLSRIKRDLSCEHRINVVAVTGTPPDENGMISLGPCPFRADLCDYADLVIVQINEKLPYVRGEQGMISADRADLLIDGTEDLYCVDSSQISETEEAIGGYISELVSDGACLQLGIGSIGSAVGSMLMGKKDLGIHTEMFVESMKDLMLCGAVNNSRKEICPGVSIFGFSTGSQALYDFLDHNAMVETRPFDFVNEPRIISQISNMVSINSAVQIDLMGQVCAESMGFQQYSGSGGQGDFVRGANWSPGGKSFIAIPSSRLDKQGERHSKITLSLPAGSSITTPRTDVHYIVTEYGVVNLRGASLEERARKLISIAHPDFRDSLLGEAKRAGLIL